jgi:hypothetical protein
LAGAQGQSRVTVAVDRTNWDFGKTAIHFLVISIVVFGVGIPIVWTQLGKKRNSKMLERLDLLERFLKLVPAPDQGVSGGSRVHRHKLVYRLAEAKNPLRHSHSEQPVCHVA